VRFEWPFALLTLILVPIATAAYLVVERRGARYSVRYTNIDVLARVSARTTPWRSYLPAGFALLALTCALVALARPERTVSTTNDQTAIVLALDTSASMAANDIHPTRLAAADQAIRRFLAQIPKKYRVALVAFSAEPYVATPLTWDHDRILQALADVSVGQGTAIGDALARSVDMLKPISKRAASATPTTTRTDPLASIGDPSAILFLSDGAQTNGGLTPLAGAARAKAVGIPVNTIALGTSRGVIGAGVMSLPVPPDPTTLRQISRATGGESFAPSDDARLEAVYQHLAIRLGRTHHRQELSFALEGLAAILALIAAALSQLRDARLP
jgi:Ca-activated chloride channel homolog